jgi:hypothetical protein
MKNLKSVHLVTAEDLLNPQLEGFLVAKLPSIHSKNRFHTYKKLKEESEKLNKAKVVGKLKLALSAMYLMTLVYFLTVLLSL